ncbi:MAG: 3-methylornithyl-N6-L-lysine dehydrogenase PylD [Dehalobacterium sp.]
MTRLTEKDIDGLGLGLTGYEIELFHKTGMTLAEIGCFAAGISVKNFTEAAKSYRVSVVPITAGKGVIGGFAQSVESIIKKLNFPVSVTNNADVSGLFEAVTKGSDIVFMADDDRFIALNLRTKKLVDNGDATGKGYVAALYGMAKGLKECDVLVLGYGPVGSHAVDFLIELGAKVAVYDHDPEKAKQIRNSKIKIESDLQQALPNYPYLLDATPGKAFISFRDLHPEAVIAAPGIPLGIDFEAYERCKERLIHDPLQIGVATMLALAVSP